MLIFGVWMHWWRGSGCGRQRGTGADRSLEVGVVASGEGSLNNKGPRERPGIRFLGMCAGIGRELVTD